MSNSKSIFLKSEAILPLSILTLILSIISATIAFFSGISWSYLIASFCLSLPVICLSILIITQEKSNKIETGFSIASLVICKAAWLIMGIILSIQALMAIIDYCKPYIYNIIF